MCVCVCVCVCICHKNETRKPDLGRIKSFFFFGLSYANDVPSKNKFFSSVKGHFLEC